MEWGLIVNCSTQCTGNSVCLSTVVLPLLLCIVLLITDDPPVPAHKKPIKRAHQDSQDFVRAAALPVMRTAKRRRRFR